MVKNLHLAWMKKIEKESEKRITEDKINTMQNKRIAKKSETIVY